jgi:hypothetical protein
LSGKVHSRPEAGDQQDQTLSILAEFRDESSWPGIEKDLALA